MPLTGNRSSSYTRAHRAEEDEQTHSPLLDQQGFQSNTDYRNYYSQPGDYEQDASADPYSYSVAPADPYLEDVYSGASTSLGAPHHGVPLSSSFYDEAAAALGGGPRSESPTRPLSYARRPLPQPAPGAPFTQDASVLPTLAYEQDRNPTYLPYTSEAQPHTSAPAEHESPHSAYDEKMGGQYNSNPFAGGERPATRNSYSAHQEDDAATMTGHEIDYYAEKAAEAGYGSDGAEGEYAYENDAWEGPEDEEGGLPTMNTQHFGPAPAKGALLRRHKTKKKIALTQGHLVLDCPVPSKLQSFLSRRGDEEFETMRYTAVTCEPDEFSSSNYTLRPQMYDRHTELFIVITLYNEDEELLCRTLHGVFKNIAHLCSRTKSRTWGQEGWKKVVVSIICDGRKKIHPRVLDCLAALGVYQEGVAKNVVNGKRVEAHLYEYTTQLSIDSNLQFKGAERGLVPVQVLLCIKERNAKKINSHRWFFNAFGASLQPNVCVLLDAGTRPEAKSIYYLWKTFDLHSNVGGACGEICADTKGRWGVGKALLNPLVAAQNFEYKMSNILDKPTESTFGYISVLPGAFSSYRYRALQNDDLGRGPLASYFKGEALLGTDADVFSSNMYLAEDRILCFELAAKRGEAWVLKYIKQARGVTDVPDNLPEFISQRRRWLNGSLFAAIYSLTHTRQFLESGHGRWRKIVLMIEAFYSLVNVCFAWFAVANFYIFFRILTASLESFNSKVEVLNTLAQYIYLGTLTACFVFSLGNRPQGSRWKYMTAAIIFGVLTLYMMIAAVVCMVHAFANIGDAVYAQMVVSLFATYGVYLISSIIAMDPLHLITSFGQYLLLSSSFINILQVYAFANIHDFSWGTKGDNVISNDLGTVTSKGNDVVEVTLPTSQLDIDSGYDEALHNLRTRPMIIKGESGPAEKELARKDYYAGVRTNVLLSWILTNGLLAGIILGGDSSSTFDASTGSSRTKVYMVLVLVFVAAMACIRLMGSTAYTVTRLVAG